MGNYKDELEKYSQITANLVHAEQIHEKRQIEREEKKEEFLKSMQELISIFREKNISPNAILKTKAITNSIEMIADSNIYIRLKLRFWRTHLLNRLQSPSKDRQVLDYLLTKYLEFWWDAYEDKYGKFLQAELDLEYAYMGLKTPSSNQFKHFLQTDVAHYMDESKKRAKKKLRSKEKDFNG